MVIVTSMMGISLHDYDDVHDDIMEVTTMIVKTMTTKVMSGEIVTIMMTKMVLKTTDFAKKSVLVLDLQTIITVAS